MQLRVSINEADVGRIKAGTPAAFTCDAFPGREFRGAVGKIRLNASLTQNVVTYTVEVDMENPDQILLPYLTANVRFILANASNVFLVPNAALRWMPSSLNEITPSFRGRAAEIASEVSEAKGKSGSGTIWLKSGGFVKPVQVKLGPSDGADTAVTADELREGELVVTGEAAAASQAEAKSPFLPKTIKR